MSAIALFANSFDLNTQMNEPNPSVVLGNSTVTNLRKLLTNLRTGKGTQPAELEIMLSRAVTDLASLLDYVELLEIQLRGLDEKDRGVQSLG